MQVDLSKLDIAILSLLQQDAMLSVQTIADKIGVSKSACWRRIQKLDELGVITGRHVVLDQNKVNLPLTVYISIRTDQHNDSWYQNFRSHCEALPEILEVHRMSGDLDYLLKAVVTDMKGYDRLYKKLIKANLLDVSAAFVMETMKQTTELPLKAQS